MNLYALRSLACSMTCLTLLSVSAQVHATPAEFSGRGVFHFASGQGCPLSNGHDSPNNDCNRIALDLADAKASVDPDSHQILIASGSVADKKTVIGDVLLHGSGLAADGQRVPLSLHVLLRRSGEVWKTDTYVHAPVRGTFSDIQLDPYRISVRQGDSERVLFTPEQARDVLAHPSLAARLASYFIAVRPSNAKQPSADDITIALGVGRVSKSLMRASFSSDPASASNLYPLTREGTWTLKLQALSGQIPLWVVQRQLFMFALDNSPLLKDVRQRGFKKHDTLELGARNGVGFLRYNGVEEAFPGAAESGYAFMRDSFIGLILAWPRSADAPSTAQAAQ
jgi:hypothetical protein